MDRFVKKKGSYCFFKKKGSEGFRFRSVRMQTSSVDRYPFPFMGFMLCIDVMCASLILSYLTKYFFV